MRAVDCQLMTTWERNQCENWRKKTILTKQISYYVPRATCYDSQGSFNNFHSSSEPDKSGGDGVLETGSFLHIKCLRLCNINKIKMLSVFTMWYPALVYILNGAVSIILQCRYTSLEEPILEISSSLAFKRCQPMPLLGVSQT